MESFVRQACGEASAVVGLLPVLNLGCRAAVRAVLQTPAQTDPVPRSLQILPQAVGLKEALAPM